jgi:hypothetical protein
MWRGLALPSLCSLTAATAMAQQPGAQPAGPLPQHNDRPGLFSLGPLWVTPRFRIGTMGIDTNVFYTATDRRTDFNASGGPGLGLVLPMREMRLLVDGDLNYVWFAKTASQRRLAGNGRGRIEVGRGRVRAGVEEVYRRTFERPNFEVDRRVVADEWRTRGDLTVDLPGRFGLRTDLAFDRVNNEQHQEYYGTDLSRTLNRDIRRALLGLRYQLTVKTLLIVEGDYEQDRFRFAKARDADSNRLYGGFEVQSTTRLAGRAVGGVRLFRLKEPASTRETSPYYDLSLAYQVGPSTRALATARRDLEFSAFETTGLTPTVDRESYSLRLEKRFFGRMSLWLYGGHDRFRTDGEVTVVDGSGASSTAVRNDDSWQGGADLGCYVRPRFRIGVAATYTQRNSRFRDFGLKGLLVGGTVTYNPN